MLLCTTKGWRVRIDFGAISGTYGMVMSISHPYRAVTDYDSRSLGSWTKQIAPILNQSNNMMVKAAFSGDGKRNGVGTYTALTRPGLRPNILTESPLNPVATEFCLRAQATRYHLTRDQSRSLPSFIGESVIIKSALIP